MNKNIFFFLVFSSFLLTSCQFFSSEKTEIIEQKDVSAFDASMELDTKYIDYFRLDGFTEKGETARYLDKKEVINAYNNGDRSLNLIRAYIYLSSLEGNFEQKEILENELCRLYVDTCGETLVQVTVSGIVRDLQSKPLTGVLIEVLGTKHTTTTDAQGKYTMTFPTQSPSLLRLRASTEDTMIDVKKIQIDDTIRKSYPQQIFEKNFTLVTPFATYQIDTSKKTIGGGSQGTTNEKGYQIITPYTRYFIPHNSIVKDGMPYQGKLKAMVFEFDRSSGGLLLDADVFDAIEGFASSLLVTYGMPYIILVAEDGTRLDILSNNPMFIATTLREKDDFMKENIFDAYYKLAYEASSVKKDTYPITNTWIFDNNAQKILPPWWVMDRATGIWDNVGFRYAYPDPYAPYNIEAPFYTLRVDKR